MKKIANNILFPFCLLGINILCYVLVHLYQGVVGDAKIYLIDVFQRLHPEYFVNDLLFIGGSQDPFSIFSFIYSPLISILGPYLAALIISTISVAFWIFACLKIISFFDFKRRYLVFIFFACFLWHYGPTNAMRMGEYLCTSRTIAEAFTLMGLLFIFKGSRRISLAMMLVGFLFHPLMGGWGLPIWMFYFFPKTIVPVCVASILLPLSMFLRHLPFDCFDSVWKQSSDEFNWGVWKSFLFFVYVMIAFLAYKIFFKSQRKFFKSLSIVCLIALYWTVVGQGIGHVFLVQVQPWRCEWILLFFAILSIGFTVKEITRPRRFLRLLRCHRYLFPLLLTIIAVFASTVACKYCIELYEVQALSSIFYLRPEIILFAVTLIAVVLIYKTKSQVLALAYFLCFAVVAGGVFHESPFYSDDLERQKCEQLNLFLKSGKAPFNEVIKNDYGHVLYVASEFSENAYWATGTYYGASSFYTFSRERFLEARRRTAQIINDPMIEQKPFVYPYHWDAAFRSLGEPSTLKRLLDIGELHYLVLDSAKFFERTAVDSLYLEALEKTVYLIER